MPLACRNLIGRASKIEFLPERRVAQEQRYVIRIDHANKKCTSPARTLRRAASVFDRLDSVPFRDGCVLRKLCRDCRATVLDRGKHE